MNKLMGGLQMAFGLLLLGTSGLCMAMVFNEITRNPALALVNPVVYITAIIFIGSLFMIRQGWRLTQETGEIARQSGRSVLARLLTVVGFYLVIMAILRLLPGFSMADLPEILPAAMIAALCLIGARALRQ